MSSESLKIDWISSSPKGSILHLQIQPRASRTEIVGPHGSPARLKVRVAAPPVEGEANEEIRRFFKKLTGLPMNSVQILRGDQSKMKDLVFLGFPADALAALVNKMLNNIL